MAMRLLWYQISFQLAEIATLASCLETIKKFSNEIELNDMKFGKEQIKKYTYTALIESEEKSLELFDALQEISGLSDLGMSKKRIAEVL
jgi:hypothetical protein